MREFYDLFTTSGNEKAIQPSILSLSLSSGKQVDLNFGNAGKSEGGTIYLGLDLSALDASELIEDIHPIWEEWIILPSHYRDPKITVQQAYEIAKMEIHRKHHSAIAST
ncbi:MAG: hypothetical protein HC910_06025 [Spirulinaceae cyanobacterium SM2_1_0]|nr:hypothetical protein [Spirulinaceae cyanobacterium SM2_1_0]NJO52341.1 hypothetical protein [Leptolyngbyaceae cyanobacterium RM2_2_4]